MILANEFAGFVCLVYHEARNVRHLIDDHLVDASGYERVRSLPRNREAAWRELQETRYRAAHADTASQASEVFVQRYGLTMEELAALYEHDGWRHASFGGNRWAAITTTVIELRNALEQGKDGLARNLASRVALMHHNNGPVAEKLAGLDTALEAPQ